MHTKTTRKQSALLGFLLLAIACACSQQSAPADPAEGMELVLQLSSAVSPDAVADEAVFQHYGLERSEKLLLAVVSTGRNPAATANDWVVMHRALDGLVELNIDRRRFFMASTYANMQDSAYRNDEGDYGSALAAARQPLNLQ
jgi:hypothetical protein